MSVKAIFRIRPLLYLCGVVVFFVASVLVYYLTVYKSVDRELESSSLKLNEARKKYALLNNMEKGFIVLDRYEEITTELVGAINKPFSSAELTSSISKILNQQDLLILNEQYSKPKQKGEVTIVESLFEIKGSYKAITRVIDGLSESGYFNEIKALQIYIDNEGLLLVNIETTFLFSKEGA